MLDEISAALEIVSPAARKRLRRCVPRLMEAMTTFDGCGPAGGLVLACSTPRCGIVLRAPGGWPQFDPTRLAAIDRADAALALAEAIESPPSTDTLNQLITASTVVLGEQALAAHAKDVAKIVQSGRLPLTVLLVDRRGRNVAMIATAVGLEAATVH